ncbi:hypothetical protein Tco_0833740 [Tanacetum coccineum]
MHSKLVGTRSGGREVGASSPEVHEEGLVAVCAGKVWEVVSGAVSGTERLFSKTYSYVDRISHLSEKPVQDLLKLHPAPPPRDAPKAGSGGIVFAPKLVKAAEVADQRYNAHLKDPASKHASGGSKAPSSKKT